MLDNNQWLGLGVIAGIAYLVDNEYRGGKEYGAESFEAEVCPCGCAMKGCVCSSSCKGERLGAESFGAEGRSFEVRDLEGNTYTLKQVSDVQLNEMKAFGDDRAYNKNIFFVDGMNGIAFYEGDRASWFGGLDYDEPKTTVIDEEGQKYDMWEKYLMEEIAEEKYMETGRGPYGFDDTNVYMTYFIMFLRDNNDEPINPQQFGFNAESFGAEDDEGLWVVESEWTTYVCSDPNKIKNTLGSNDAFIPLYRPDLGMPENWEEGGMEWLEDWVRDNTLETVAREMGFSVRRVPKDAMISGYERRGLYIREAESFEAEERWYLSDPCYAIPYDRWDEFIHLVFANPNYDRNERMNIEWEVDGEDYIVEVWDSPGGDGVWRFSVGEFGVDAGLLAVIPEKVAMEGGKPHGGEWFDKKPTLFTDNRNYVVKVNGERNQGFHAESELVGGV